MTSGLPRSRLAAIIAAAVAGLIAADWAACAYLGHRMQVEYDSWVRSVTAQGWTVRTDSLVREGTPLGATLTVSGLDLAGGRAMLPGGLDWHADRVLLTIPLYRFWRLSVAPEGEQTLRVSGTDPIAFSAEHLVAQIPLGQGRPDSLDLTAEDLTAGLRDARQHSDVRIHKFALHFGATTRTAARIDAWADVKASAIDLPDTIRWPLGAEVQSAAASFSLASPALSGARPAEQARAWRDWGGTLSVRNLDLHWGPLALTSDASLNLDPALQPAGHGQAIIRGWQETIDALAASGAIPPGMAQTVKFVMGLMPRAPSADGDALSLPLTLKDSTLSVGKIPLLHLHGIRWDAA